jgi:hypothetical protein
MRRKDGIIMRLLTLVAVVPLLVSLPEARVADPAGTWRAEFTGPAGTTATETLTLTVKDTVVTGTFENALGDVGPIRDGQWDGTTIRFWVPWDRSDKLVANGRFVGANLEITLKTSQWQAKRAFRRLPPPKSA